MTGVVLLSGGLDSSTLLFDLLNTGKQVEGLFINYGQRMAGVEMKAAGAICAVAGVQLHTLDIPLPRDFGSGWLLDAPTTPDWQHHHVTLWPHRNLLLITLAAMLATTKNASDIYLGLMDIEAEPFPDSTPVFMSSLEAVLRQTAPHLRLHAPFMTWTKRQIAIRALQLGMPIELTFSCTYSSDHHCCSCPSCLDRIDALDYARKHVNNGEQREHVLP